MGILTDWELGLKPATRRLYGGSLRRLLHDSELSAEEALEKVKSEYPRFDTYSKLRMRCNRYTDSVKHASVFALHSFLISGGVQVLPRARVSKPQPVKVKVALTWDQANRIIDAMNKPYNLVAKVMLHCGWGIGEFLKFNVAESWLAVKKYLDQNPNSEYYRHDFTGRKRNVHQWYSLIPTTILREVLDNCETPIKAKYGLALSVDEQGKKHKYKTEGIVLDTKHYHSARTYIETAFRTALRRAPVSIHGKPSPHEIRDTFRTHATRVGCAAEAAEFALGHEIDALGYNKIFTDESWMWMNLRKIYGPTAATREEVKTLEEQNKIMREILARSLRTELDKLTREERAIVESLGLSVTEETVSRRSALGWTRTDTQFRLAAPRLTEIREAIQNIQTQLRALGLSPEPVKPKAPE
jgi:integrase